MKAHLQSPIGWLEITATEKGISKVRKIDPPTSVEQGQGLALQCKQQLIEYFAGERHDFDLKYDWTEAPEFQRRVWAELLKIPYGRTTSYGAIAEKLGDANACRAVGMANRMNRMAIIVPCHRVIAKSGELQGYFYGLDTKRQLLQLENPKSFAVQGSLFE